MSNISSRPPPFMVFVCCNLFFNFKSIISMSKFFHHCGRGTDFSYSPTLVLCPEQSKDGSSIIVTKVLESLNDPFAALSFDDFSIQKCLENGVTYKALGITPEMRLGHESEFEAFEAKFMEMQDKFFVQPSKSE